MAKRLNLNYKQKLVRYKYHPKAERKVPVLIEKEFTLKTREVKVDGQARKVGTTKGHEVLIAYKAGLPSVDSGVKQQEVQAEIWVNKTKYKRYLEYHNATNR